MKHKHLTAAFLAITLAIGFGFGNVRSVCALGHGTMSPFDIPEGYVEADADTKALFSNFAFVYLMNDTIDFTYGPVTGTQFLFLSGVAFNSLDIVTTDNDAFLQIYAKYEDALSFDSIDEPHYSGSWVYHFFDYLNADGVHTNDPADFPSKQLLIQKFCDECKASGILKTADYNYASSNICSPIYDGLRVSGLTTDDLEGITAIATTFNPNAFVETVGTSDNYAFTIKYTAFDQHKALEAALTEAYPDITCAYALLENLSGNSSLSKNHVHMMTTSYAQQKGDVDNDLQISINDAYQTLLYSSEISAGIADPTFTDGSDATAEAAAFAAADVNADGAITIDDAFRILSYTSVEAAGGTGSWE